MAQSTSDERGSLAVYVVVLVVLWITVSVAIWKTPRIVDAVWGLSLQEETKRGSFGDQFGVTNALFSGLAFAGVIVTLVMQSQELRLQRKELTHTQRIMEEQREEFEHQVQALNRQNFESTLFRMLDVVRNCRDELEVCGTMTLSPSGKHGMRRWNLDHDGRVTGVDAYEAVFFGLQKRLMVAELLEKAGGPGLTADVETVPFFEAMYEFTMRNSFGRYFRMCYLVLQHIHDNMANDDGTPSHSGQNYAQILRAQLSRPELVILFYYGESKYGNVTFKKMADLYHLYRDISSVDLADRSDRELSKSYFSDDPRSSRVRDC